MKKVFFCFVLYILKQATAYAREVVLTWIDHSDDENGFVIERTLSPNCLDGWEVIGYAGANQTYFIDIHIPGACYRIAAYNERGISAYSNAVQMSMVQGAQQRRPATVSSSP